MVVLGGAFGFPYARAVFEAKKPNIETKTPDAETKRPDLRAAFARLAEQFNEVKAIEENHAKCWKGIAAGFPAGLSLKASIQDTLTGAEESVRAGERAITQGDLGGLDNAYKRLIKLDESLKCPPE
jgi:hypothetical protein